MHLLTGEVLKEYKICSRHLYHYNRWGCDNFRERTLWKSVVPNTRGCEISSILDSGSVPVTCEVSHFGFGVTFN